MTTPEEMLQDAIKSAADAAIELRTAYVFSASQLERANARIAELEKEVEALRTERDTLRTALQPFANIPEADVDTAAHYWCVIGHPGKSHFTREDLHRAKAALNPPTQNGEA